MPKYLLSRKKSTFRNAIKALRNVKLAGCVFLLPAIIHAQDDPWDVNDWSEGEQDVVWSGFFDIGIGTRLEDDRLVDNRNTLEEFRWRIELKSELGRYTLGFKTDAGYDGIEQQSYADLRDLTIAFPLGQSVDMKIGRQVQTWGTGDLVFLNDLFPKDFVSFFSGRDDEYLKAPSDAIRISGFSSLANIDFVWTPVFDPDNYLTGERFSFFSPLGGDNIAPEPPLSAIEPDESLSNGEFALRLFLNIHGSEYAVYAYRGFFKQPLALTPSFEATFAPLNVLGASLRRTAGPGLFSAEFSYYDSRDDRDGDDPLTPNDQLRLLGSYEWEARPRFTVGLQYYLEWTLNHDVLIENSPFAQYEPDEYRHLLTSRLTYRSNLDKFTWSLFTFYSPSDSDIYLRPSFTYRHSDQWSLSAGGNIFDGSDPQTFFSQLQDASNVYLRLRYHY